MWSWPDALFGVLIAVPAALAASHDVTKGLAFAVGVIPAAAVGIAPLRRRRLATIVVGATAGLSVLAGSVVAQVPVLAVVAVFAFAVGAAAAAGRAPAGRLLMVLALPLVGVGLSYTDIAESAGLGLIMAAGSLWAALVSMAWPERPAPTAPAAPLPTGMAEYGVRLGLAAATAAAIGFALGLDHVGWACAAALLVMRPAQEMLEARAIGRLASVAVGATLAGVAATAGPDPWVYGVLAIVAIGSAAATHRSRWYVLPTFTTFLALSLIVHSDPSTADSRWLERMAETVLGVALAYLFGVVLRRPDRSTRTPRR